MSAGQLLRDARRKHGVSQLQLARRAGTTQSAISRLERDRVSPTVDTLSTLLDLVGEELVLSAREVDYGHDRTLIRNDLAVSVEERLERATAAARGVREPQSARRN